MSQTEATRIPVLQDDNGLHIQIPTEQKLGCKTSPRQIVMARKGYIFFGNVTREGEYYVIRNGGQVRRYVEPNGGLMYLASHKPSNEKTVLDLVDCVRMPVRNLEHFIDILDGGI